MLLKILGKGIISGGNYEDIVAKGNVKLEGLVKCNNLKGSGKIKGENLECAEVCKVSGKSYFAKNVKVNDITISGNFACSGELTVNKVLKSKGVAKCKTNLKASEVLSSGVLKVNNDIDTEVLKLNGAMNCNDLNSKEIEINISGKSKIGSIKCEKLNCYVRGFKKFFQAIPLISILFKKLNKIVVENDIVGKEVYVENLTSAKVISKNVIIGRGCSIDLVQYSDEIKISKKAKVGKVEKVEE